MKIHHKMDYRFFMDRQFQKLLKLSISFKWIITRNNHLVKEKLFSTSSLEYLSKIKIWSFKNHFQVNKSLI